MAALVVLVCVRTDTERSRPGLLAGALREDEGVTDGLVVEFVRVTGVGGWARFGGPGAGLCWTSGLNVGMIRSKENEQECRNSHP